MLSSEDRITNKRLVGMHFPHFLISFDRTYELNQKGHSSSELYVCTKAQLHYL